MICVIGLESGMLFHSCEILPYLMLCAHLHWLLRRGYSGEPERRHSRYGTFLRHCFFLKWNH